MFERFDKKSSALVAQARDEARLQGAAKLEAEHLLLALSRNATWEAGRVLADAGLDHEGLSHALDAEIRRSLEAAGVTASLVALAERPLPTTEPPRWGASSKSAIERALTIAKTRGDRRIVPSHILIGVVSAEEGTVARALEVAGVDARVLVERAEATLGQAR